MSNLLDKIRNKSHNQKMKLLIVFTSITMFFVIVAWYFLNSTFGDFSQKNKADVSDNTFDGFVEIFSDLFLDLDGVVDDFKTQI